jgi:hypothetical protein
MLTTKQATQRSNQPAELETAMTTLTAATTETLAAPAATDTFETDLSTTSTPETFVELNGGFARAAALNLSLNNKTLAGIARQAILTGQDNEQVIAAIKSFRPNFPHVKHAYYARWYRAQLVMLGVIEAEVAAEFSRR